MLLLEVSDDLGDAIFGFSDKNCVYDHKLRSVGPRGKKNHLVTAHSDSDPYANCLLKKWRAKHEVKFTEGEKEIALKCAVFVG